MLTLCRPASAPVPFCEHQRQRTLEQTGILDAGAHGEFDRLTALAASRYGTQYALVSMMDRNRNVFKSCMGLTDVAYTPRDIAFCSYTIAQNDVMVVLDAREDARFVHNPLVREKPGIRFYAGTPVIVDGMNIGAFSVFDDAPREKFARQEEQELKAMAALVANCVEAFRFEHLSRLELAEQVERKRQYLESQQVERSRFVSLLSHELRTPIHAVLGFADILLKAPEGDLDRDLRQDYLGEIRAGGERMQRLVASAIRFASADNGQMTLIEEALCPDRLARSALSAVRVDLTERDIELQLDNRLDSGTLLKADFTQTEQILVELLENAIHASPRGGTVVLGLSCSGGGVTFSIEDEGPGFETPDLAAMTRPFATGPALLNKSTEGLGLGLPLATRLARLQGADIGLENGPDGGGIARLAFPAFRTLSG